MTIAGEPSRALATGNGRADAMPQMTEPEFTRVYHAHSGSLLGYLLAVTGRRDLAEDLLQETFFRLLTHPQPHLEPQQLRRFLFRIATNLRHDRWRRGDDQPFADPPEPSHTPAPHTSLDIHAALAHLKPREREFLWLAYVEGLDHAEIAAATGVTRLSVRILLHRARNKAAQFLEPARSPR